MGEVWEVLRAGASQGGEGSGGANNKPLSIELPLPPDAVAVPAHGPCTCIMWAAVNAAPSSVIAGVAAAIISHPADTLLSKVNKAGAGGTGSIAWRLYNIAAETGM